MIKKICSLLTIMMVAMVSVSLSSCSDNDNDNGNNTDETADVIEKNGVLQVNVKIAGNFATLIGDARKYQTGKLKVSGFINGDDFRCIRDMMITANGGRLEYLDMADASIVAGGGSIDGWNTLAANRQASRVLAVMRQREVIGMT